MLQRMPSIFKIEKSTDINSQYIKNKCDVMHFLSAYMFSMPIFFI